LLTKEKEAIKARDALAAERRRQTPRYTWWRKHDEYEPSPSEASR
jgi:predicted dithiol-disulfide oxidoreductase (DUF899 family)